MADASTDARASWSGKLAFVLAAAASAVGLGSLWRFPYLAAKYGGGAFTVVYLLFVFTIGLSLLLLEVALGRKTGQSAVGAFKGFGKKFTFIGLFTSAIPFIIVPYYSVIGGWVTKYMVGYVSDGSAALADGGAFFSNFISSDAGSAVFVLLFLAVAFIVVSLGVNGGIEKANLVMMPMLIIISVGVSAYALTLPGAMDGLAYYLIPDMSKFSFELIIAALGQTFYTLSLAMGIMITYGSYLDKKTSLTTSTAQISATTFGVSLLAGLMIVPATYAVMGSAEAVAENSGPSLMFLILPQVFQNMGSAAGIVGFVFFVLVFFAALTSTISLIETCVSIVVDAGHFTRKKAIITVMLWTMLMAVVVNAGYGSLAFIQPLGEGSSILDALDFVSNSLMMPLAALMTCVFVGWIIGPKVISEEVKLSAKFGLEKAWTVIIKFIAPVVLLAILIAYVAQALGLFSM